MRSEYGNAQAVGHCLHGLALDRGEGRGLRGRLRPAPVGGQRRAPGERLGNGRGEKEGIELLPEGPELGDLPRVGLWTG